MWRQLRILLSVGLLCDLTVGLKSSLSRFSACGDARRIIASTSSARAPMALHSSQETSGSSVNTDGETFLKIKRDEALKALDAIESLQLKLKEKGSNETVVYEELQEVEQVVNRLTSQRLPPQGLSLEDYKAAMRSYIDLPYVIREALCEAVGIKGVGRYEALYKAPDVVSLVYELGPQLTQQRLQDALKLVEKRRQPPRNPAATSFEKEIERLADIYEEGKANGKTAEQLQKENSLQIDRLADLFVEDMSNGKTREQIKYENVIKQYLPRVTRKEGKEATTRDLDTLMAVLNQSKGFVVSKSSLPEPIPGGYIVRGANRKKSGQELIEELDSKLPASWDAQVCFLPDITSTALDSPDDQSIRESDPVLVLTKADMAPTTSRWILSFSTAAALTTSFLFAFECYGHNEAIGRYITDLTAVGDYSAVNWFNYKLLDLLLPLVVIQGLHEAGHLLVASRDKITTSPPTLLPFWTLPIMGAQTQIKTSPRNLSSLFDFAFLGPLFGIISSLLFLGYGLQRTITADTEAMQYFPMLPVEVLRLSTLGGTVVDAFFGSGGIITSQDPSTSIPLHPFAIAGFCGLFINALDMLPLGSTDGGRLSQSVFGRNGHLLLGGFTWTALFLSTFLLEHQDLLLYAWILNNVAQNDMEVPCRDEVDPIGWPRILGASALWVLAIAALLPMD